MNRIQQLRQEGQSIWLDFIERTLIQTGGLQKLIDDGITGVTSNPTIFQNAISSSDAYRADLQRLISSGRDAKAIFENLAVADIRAAADVLRPVYERTNGQDGFVSLEVAPDLAYDTAQTVAEARRLHAAVERPNLMIKVPATEAGLPAIRQLIADGININVTLIFSQERYAAVMEAYIRGLEDRHAAGKSLDQIASVASFFVSRVDNMVDPLLSALGESHSAQGLMGKIAVANAKLAYAHFQEIFAGDRWQALAAAGAQLQRPLWASTSTKNPSYSDLLYVDSLIGPHTVNTMPPKTLDAFRDHGTVGRTIDQKLEIAQEQMAELAALGIDMREVTGALESEGVQKFADSYVELLAAIEQQRREITAAD